MCVSQPVGNPQVAVGSYESVHLVLHYEVIECVVNVFRPESRKKLSHLDLRVTWSSATCLRSLTAAPIVSRTLPASARDGLTATSDFTNIEGAYSSDQLEGAC